jgi:hypothetical protein
MEKWVQVKVQLASAMEQLVLVEAQLASDSRLLSADIGAIGYSYRTIKMDYAA